MAASKPAGAKLRLIKDKQGGTGGGIAIRFSAGSAQDDNDDDILLGMSTPSPVEEDTYKPLSSSAIDEKSSLSPKKSFRSSPSRNFPFSSAGSSPVQDSERSILSGLKEKIHDPIAAIRDKIESIHNDSDRKLRNSDSFDSSDGYAIGKEPKTSSSRHSRASSADGEEIFPRAVDLVDDFFTASNTSTLENKLSAETVYRKSDSGFASSNGSKTRNSPLHLNQGNRPKEKSVLLPDHPVVSMSTLLSSTTPDEEEFFDPKEETDDLKTKDKPEDATQICDTPEKKRTVLCDSDSQSCPSVTDPSQLSAFFTTWSTSKLLTVTAVFFAYMLAPIPPYICGLMTGCVIGVFFVKLHSWLMIPPKPTPAHYVEPLESLPPLQVPEMRESKNEPGKFKGWLNELSVYDPGDYHISATRSVYVQLEGTRLRLQTPKLNVPKRAMWNEPHPHTSTFIHQRFYDLEGSKVYLLPHGLVKKRLWSKKYPICINIAKTTKSERKLFTQGSFDTIQSLVKNKELAATEMKSDMTTSSPHSVSASDMGYELIHSTFSTSNVLYLFARTCREKEEWYRRLQAAAAGAPLPTQMVELLAKLQEDVANAGSRPSSVSSENDVPLLEPSASPAKTSIPQSATDSNIAAMSGGAASNSAFGTSPFEQKPQEEVLLHYMKYMARLMPTDSLDRFFASASLSRKVLSFHHGLTTEAIVSDDMVWFNAVLGRIFWDFLLEKKWGDYVKDKIQKKLSKIHVPYFIDELTVTDIDLGKAIPLIRRASKPYVDDRGLWIDLDVAYGGGFSMSLETKVNLMKLKKAPAPAAPPPPPAPNTLDVHFVVGDKNLSSSGSGTVLYREPRFRKRLGSDTKRQERCKRRCKKSPVTDSDEEDSAESSTDEELEENTPQLPPEERGHGSGNTSKKLLRLVDKIAASRYFQQATEYKYIKKAMEEVSNTRLMLSVEMRSCVGQLAVNIPPPPSDRIWYGFRQNPRLYLCAKPQVGERTISVSHITEWIEKKLAIEFQRILVFPNMDDIPLPLMCDKLHSALADMTIPDKKS